MLKTIVDIRPAIKPPITVIFIRLSALELEKYESLQQQSYREALSKEINAAHVWQVAMSPPWEHALLTPKPDVRDRITALIQAKGDAKRGIRE